MEEAKMPPPQHLCTPPTQVDVRQQARDKWYPGTGVRTWKPIMLTKGGQRHQEVLHETLNHLPLHAIRWGAGISHSFPPADWSGGRQTWGILWGTGMRVCSGEVAAGVVQEKGALSALSVPLLSAVKPPASSAKRARVLWRSEEKLEESMDYDLRLRNNMNSGQASSKQSKQNNARHGTEISRAAFTYARERLTLVFAFVGGQVCNLAPHNQIQASSPKYASSLAAQQKERADHLHGSHPTRHLPLPLCCLRLPVAETPRHTPPPSLCKSRIAHTPYYPRSPASTIPNVTTIAAMDRSSNISTTTTTPSLTRAEPAQPEL
ncbi:hypothetical protein Q7P35_000941 [Cladosporium inversicolor]